jgi:hypothetical protein
MKEKIIVFLSLALFILHAPLFAKRAYIKYPDKITIDNIEYKASYEMGNLVQKAYIEARNIETEEIIWKKKIYQIMLNPVLEQDVQWIMITDVKEKNGQLIISNEKKDIFSLDLKTLEVKKTN